MEELTKIFNNPKFGVLEVVLIDGKEFFPATEVAKMLGYTNPEKAIRDHCKTPGCTIRSVGVETGTKADGTPAIQIVQKKYIHEGNLYRLITHSKLPAAEKFESWVFDEVIPDIRRTGMYRVDGTNTGELLSLSSETIARIVTTAVTETVKQLLPLMQSSKGLPDHRLSSTNNKPVVTLANCTAEQQKEILLWSAVLREWDEYCVGKPKTQATIDYAAEASPKYPNLKISVGILYRKKRALKEFGECGLIDTRGGQNKGSCSIPEAVWQVFWHYYSENQYTIRECVVYTTKVLAYSHPELLPLPSERTFRRHLRACLTS